MTHFYNDPWFQTLVIFIVGLFAFISYRIQIINKYRNIASMLTNEICEIENSIKNLKSINNYYYSTPIFYTDTWNKYKYMFVKYLGQEDYTLINAFYINAKQIEAERLFIKNIIEVTLTEKAKIFQRLNKELILKNLDDLDKYVPDVNAAFKILSPPGPEFSSSFSYEYINKLMLEIRMVTSTMAFQKLEKASNKKWYSFTN